MKQLNRYMVILITIHVVATCRKPYAPPAITSVTNNFLVVDGVVNTEPGSVTGFVLSRARRLVDTVLFIPELHAQIQIISDKNAVFHLHETGGGNYKSDPLTLNPGDKYSVKVVTQNGTQYASDFVGAKHNAPIDSLTWTQDNENVTIYANTHDPTNNSRYYRWDYLETWEYHATNEAILGLDNNNMIFFRDSTTQVYKCWQTLPSTEIALATSVQLSQDVIDHAPVAVLPNDGSTYKLSVRYSILVNQYALTEDAYDYWGIVQKSTQQTGGIFDAQPAQLIGNYHNVNNPSEPVIGYLSACAVKQQRLFIDNHQVVGWVPPNGISCVDVIIPQDPNNFAIYHGTDTTYTPYHFVSGGGIALQKKDCLDCRRAGGTTDKPSFW